MAESITITALVENTVNVGGLRAEHGLTLLLRIGNRTLLFDTGRSDMLVHNAHQLGIDLRKLDTIVLSHGHYDHTGGLEAVHQLAPQAKLLLHPAAILPKFSINPDSSIRPIGMKPASLAVLAQAKPTITWTAKPAEIMVSAHSSLFCSIFFRPPQNLNVPLICC